jgi:hypothetical protein
MPATATGRGAQVVVDPFSDTAKAMRGAYATTFEGNAAKIAADIASGAVAHGNGPDASTAANVATDQSVSPSVAPKQAGSLVIGTTAGPTIRAGTGVASGTQPSGSVWIRTDGAAGARLYVSQGGGTWIAIATV